jgi:glycosyltransferase involved in cell wall biosynthesis
VSILPIDVEHYHQRTQRAHEGAGAEALKSRFPGQVILSVGQLIARKGHREMLKIFEQVQQARPDVSLVILGEGPLHDKLEKIVAKKGLDNVFFEGFVQADAVPEYLAVADVCVFHTLFDTFGAVLPEAMAAGCVCVSSIHAAATADLVIEGETGFVFDPKKSGPAVSVILEALDLDQAARARIGQAAYQMVAPHNYKDAARAMVAFMLAAQQGTHG